jgi:type I restriction enzyme S subunit
MSASKWKPYPKYSDKGIDWLGEVPEHWDISTPRLMFEEIKDKNTDSARTNFLSLVSKKGIIPYEEKGSMGNKMSVNIDHYTLVNKGDFVLNSMNFGIGGFGVSPYDGITSPAYVVLRPIVEESMTRYLAKIFEDEGFQKGTAILGDGILELRRAIGWKHLKRQPIPIPTHEERMAISRFLESRSNYLDKAIRALQNMLIKLEEKRLALISQTVKKGLNPDVPMKDSGIDWYGLIPQSWSIKMAKYAFILQRGQDLSSEQFVRGNYPVCSSNSIMGFHNKSNAIGPSVVVGRSGSVGAVNFVETNFFAHNTALYIKKFHDAIPKFIYYLLTAMNLPSFAAGSAVGTLNRNHIHRQYIAIPSIEEQTEIVSYIENQISINQDIKEKLLIEIEKLKIYRTALISAVVTGKIDVRGL